MTAGGDAAPLVETARVKINLCLHVLGRRADGYHLLDGLTAFAGLGDRLTATPAEEFGLSLSGPFASALGGEGDNLVLRTARALAQRLGESRGAALTLDKRLPVASGIGGGSADAAATLRLLERLWDRRLPAAEREVLALSLGADVPVCLAGRAAFVRGVGEVIAPAPPLPAAWLLLANPGVGVSTPAVFSRLAGRFSAPVEAPPAEGWADAGALAAWLHAQRNDLEVPAREVCSAVGEVLAALAAQPEALLARMSGSGATCFALFGTYAAAETSRRAVARAHPGWWTATTELAA